MPRVNPTRLAQCFQINDEVCSRIVAQLAVGSRSARTPLIEEDYSITRRFKIPPARCGTSPAWSAMKENHGNTLRVPALFPIQRVNLISSQTPRSARFNL